MKVVQRWVRGVLPRERWDGTKPIGLLRRGLGPFGRHPGASWSLAWVALFAGGMVLASYEQGPAGPWMLACLLTGLFPALTVVGALGFAGLPAPLWLIPAGVGLGGLRALLLLWLGPAPAHGLALAYEPAAALAAAAIVVRADLLRPAPWLRASLGAAFVLLAGLEGADAFTSLDGAPHPLVFPAWFVVAPLVALLEVSAMGLWIARRESRMEHAEGTQRQLEADLLQRERTEARLRQKEAWLFDFYEKAPDMLLALRPGSYEILRCNRKFSETLGHPRRRIVGRSLLDFVDPGTLDAKRAELEQVSSRRYLRDVQLRLQRRNGRLFDVLANVALRPEPSGGAQLRAVLHDVTHFRRAAGEEGESDALYRTLVAQAPVGIFYADNEGRCLFVNERFCELSGLTPDQARSHGWLESAENRDAARSAWQVAVRARASYRARHRIRAGPGEPTHVVAECTPLFDEDGEVFAWVGSLTPASPEDRRAPEPRKTPARPAW